MNCASSECGFDAEMTVCITGSSREKSLHGGLHKIWGRIIIIKNGPPSFVFKQGYNSVQGVSKSNGEKVSYIAQFFWAAAATKHCVCCLRCCINYETRIWSLSCSSSFTLTLESIHHNNMWTPCFVAISKLSISLCHQLMQRSFSDSVPDPFLKAQED